MCPRCSGSASTKGLRPTATAYDAAVCSGSALQGGRCGMRQSSGYSSGEPARHCERADGGWWGASDQGGSAGENSRGTAAYRVVAAAGGIASRAEGAAGTVSMSVRRCSTDVGDG